MRHWATAEIVTHDEARNTLGALLSHRNDRPSGNDKRLIFEQAQNLFDPPRADGDPSVDKCQQLASRHLSCSVVAIASTRRGVGDDLHSLWRIRIVLAACEDHLYVHASCCVANRAYARHEVVVPGIGFDDERQIT